MPGEVTLVVRPEKRRGVHGLFAGRTMPGTDFVFETPGGERVAEIKLHLRKPNEFHGPRVATPLTLAHEGLLVPRFEARRPDGSLFASLEYEFVTGAMDLVLSDGTRHRLERDGIVLPTTRLVDVGGRTVLEVATWRLYGKEFRVTLRPAERWSEPDLLAVAALVFHARVSVSILFSAAATAGVLAPARPTR